MQTISVDGRKKLPTFCEHNLKHFNVFSQLMFLLYNAAAHCTIALLWLIHDWFLIWVLCVWFTISVRPVTVSSMPRIMLQFRSMLLKSIQTLASRPEHQKPMLSAAQSVWWANQMIALPVWLNATICLQSKSSFHWLSFASSKHLVKKTILHAIRLHLN